MTPLQKYEHFLAHPPKPDAPPAICLAHLRAFAGPWCHMMAAWHLAGDDADDPERCFCDCFLAAVEHAAGCGYPEFYGVSVGLREWQAGLDKARALIVHLGRALGPMARRGAESETMLLEAHSINDRHGMLLPAPLLIDQARRIVAASKPRKRARFVKPF